MNALPRSARRYLAGLLVFLAGATAIGGLYGAPGRGLLVASLAALAWLAWQLVNFERALSRREYDRLPYGEGIWAGMHARLRHLKERNRRHKGAYRRLLRELRQSADALPDGGVILDADYGILFCNRAAERLAGFDARKDRGQRADNILRDPGFVEYLRAGRHGGGVEIPAPTGGDRWLLLQLVPFGPAQRLLLIRDVTERRRLAEMRREFVANASHELRSPLTVLTGYLDALLQDSDLPGHWQKPLRQMHGQAARMTRVVSDLLELSRLDDSQESAGEERVGIAEILATQAELHRDEAGPAIAVNADSRIALRGDAAEIETVVANLLSNACRHTPAEGNIRLSWQRENGEDDGAVLAVEDSGEGIAEEHIPRLTERFYRVDQGRSREEGGTGLGLSIVKHILKRHDAHLDISSSPGQGSRFACRFPAARLTGVTDGGIAGAEPA